MANHNLPSFPTPFVGRTDEIFALSQLLDNTDCRLLTFVGPGGIGKTRLVVEIARRQLNKFPDGVYFVPLQPLQSAEQVVSTVVDVLPLQITANPQQELLDYVREKRLLLIMDNFEQVLIASALVDAILMQAPRIVILITSREILKLQGEWVRTITGLTYPNDRLAKKSDNYSAIELFATTAQRIRGNFSLNNEYEHIIRICQLVEGMPLALELAAGWTKILSCAVIAKEIQQGIDFLISDLHNMPKRHSSIRVVLEYSWKLMTEDERAVLRRLSIFKSGFTLEAAEQVAQASRTILAALADKSLIKLDSQGRYSLHELLRQFAEEQLNEANETIVTGVQYCEYYAALMEHCKTDMKGRRQLQVLSELTFELENVLFAWQRAIDYGRMDLIDRLLEGTFLYCDLTCHHEDYRQVFERTLEYLKHNDEGNSSLMGRVKARCFNGFMNVRQHIEQALALARAEGNNSDIAYSLYRYAMYCEDVSGALLSLEQSLHLYRQLNDPFYLSRVQLEIGRCYEHLGHLDVQSDYFDQSISLKQRIGDEFGMFFGLDLRGQSAFVKGDFAWVENRSRELIPFYESRFNLRGYMRIHALLGWIYLIRGETDQAEGFFDVAYRGIQDTRYPEMEVIILAGQSVLCSLKEQYEEAQQYIKRAQPASLPMTYQVLPLMQNFMMSWASSLAEYGLSNHSQAHVALEKASKAASTLSSLTFNALSLPMISLLCTEAGRLQDATEILSFVQSHFAEWIGWTQDWPVLVRHKERLRKRLGEQIYTEAWERGLQLNVEQVNRKLLREFTIDADALILHANQRFSEPLTRRELEVLALIVEGFTNREIADRLYIGINTVKKHVNHIYSKLDVKDRSEAVDCASKLGLIL